MHLKFYEHSASVARPNGSDSSAGYTEEEKLNIARRYLLPKQFENNGLEAKQVKMSDGAILDLIRHYTREVV